MCKSQADLVEAAILAVAKEKGTFMKLTLDELEIIISSLEMFRGDDEEADKLNDRFIMEFNDRIIALGRTDDQHSAGGHSLM